MTIIIIIIIVITIVKIVTGAPLNSCAIQYWAGVGRWLVNKGLEHDSTSY